MPVRFTPGAQFGVAGMAWIDIGEPNGRRRFRICRQGQLQGGIVGLFSHGSLIEPRGEHLARDAQGLKKPTSSGSVGSQGSCR